MAVGTLTYVSSGEISPDSTTSTTLTYTIPLGTSFSGRQIFVWPYLTNSTGTIGVDVTSATLNGTAGTINAATATSGTSFGEILFPADTASGQTTGTLVLTVASTAGIGANSVEFVYSGSGIGSVSLYHNTVTDALVDAPAGSGIIGLYFGVTPSGLDLDGTYDSTVFGPAEVASKEFSTALSAYEITYTEAATVSSAVLLWGFGPSTTAPTFTDNSPTGPTYGTAVTTTVTATGAGSFTFTQDGILDIVEAWGSGASAGRQTRGSGGGAYASSTLGGSGQTVTAGQVVYWNVGAGVAGTTTTTATAGNQSWIRFGTNSVPTASTDGAKAAGGSAGTTTVNGAGGSVGNSIGWDLPFGGGAGSNTGTGTTLRGGGGGGAGSNTAGGNASAGTAGVGGTGGGGAGGAGVTTGNGGSGVAPGGGGGSTSASTGTGGAGARGQVQYTFRPLISGGSGNGTAAGTTTTASASTISGTARGGATKAGSTVSVTATITGGTASGTAAVDATANGDTATSTASVIDGSAAGGASISGASVSATTSVTSGSAVGTASASGSTVSSTASVTAGTATGTSTGTATGDIVTSSTSAVAGTASGNAAASGTTTAATTSVTTGTASGTGVASGATVSATASVNAGTATGTTAGALGASIQVTTTVLSGTAQGNASALGSIVTATITVVPGVAVYIPPPPVQTSGKLLIVTTSVIPGSAVGLGGDDIMAITTMQNIITRVETKLSLLGGLDVQTYGQPKIAEFVQSVFNDVYRKQFWKVHTKTAPFALTGSDGLPVQDMSTIIKDFSDIQYIWLNGYMSPLAEGPYDLNPSLINAPCFLAYGDPTKVFQIYPLKTTGNVTVRFRTLPNDFIITDTIPFDAEYIIFEVVAQYLIFEGANTAAAKDMRNKADTRLKHIAELEMAKEKSLYGVANSTQDMWRDA